MTSTKELIAGLRAVRVEIYAPRADGEGSDYRSVCPPACIEAADRLESLEALTAPVGGMTLETTAMAREALRKTAAENAHYTSDWDTVAPLVRDFDRVLAERNRLSSALAAKEQERARSDATVQELGIRLREEQARNEKAEAVVAELRRAGQGLSNMAYNLAQSPTMEERMRQALRDGYKKWDEALALLSPEGKAKGEDQPPRDADPVPATGWRPVTDEAKTGARVLLWVCSRGSIRRGIAQIGWWGHHVDFGQTWLLRVDHPVDPDAVMLWQPIEEPAGITAQGGTDV